MFHDFKKQKKKIEDWVSQADWLGKAVSQFGHYNLKSMITFGFKNRTSDKHDQFNVYETPWNTVTEISTGFLVDLSVSW